MEKVIIINSIFNKLKKKHEKNNPNPQIVLTKKWIEERMNVFMNSTSTSLQKQTNQNFIAIIQYEDSTEKMIFEALQKYPNLPENIMFIRSSKAAHLISQKIRDFQKLYLVRIDSDDMYHSNFVNILHKYNPMPKTKALINQHGFIYDSIHHRLAPFHRESPPFYTFIYNTEDYLNGTRYKISTHREAIQLPHEVLKGNNFMVNIHSINSSTTFDKRTGKPVNKKDINRILNYFK